MTHAYHTIHGVRMRVERHGHRVIVAYEPAHGGDWQWLIVTPAVWRWWVVLALCGPGATIDDLRGAATSSGVVAAGALEA
jgi:hypothetical protein